MHNLIPMLSFIGCVLAALALVGVCEWLQPRDRTHEPDHARDAGTRHDSERKAAQ